MGYIYRITNLENNKIYIGQTMCNPETRWGRHKNAIKNGRGCTALRNAVIKHGIDNFKMDVIIICFDEDRFIYEKHYIQKYNSLVPNGYNITPGGEGGGGFIGKNHTIETKAKLSQYIKNPENTKKTQAGLIKYWSDPVKRKEQSERMKLVSKGTKSRSMSIETKTRISESLKLYNKNIDDSKIEEFKKNQSKIMTKAIGRAVGQYDLEGNFIKSYDTIIQAARAVNAAKNGICQVISGKGKTCKGYIWKYLVEISQ